MVAADMRRRILGHENTFRLVTSAATSLASILERTLSSHGRELLGDGHPA